MGLYVLRFLLLLSLGIGEGYALHCFVCSYHPIHSEVGCSGDPENDGDYVEVCPNSETQCFWRRISQKPTTSNATKSDVLYEAGCTNTSATLGSSCETNVTEDNEVEVCIRTCDWLICNYPTNSFDNSSVSSDNDYIIDDSGFTTDSDWINAPSNVTLPTTEYTTVSNASFTSNVTNSAVGTSRFGIYHEIYGWRLQPVVLLSFLIMFLP